MVDEVDLVLSEGEDVVGEPAGALQVSPKGLLYNDTVPACLVHAGVMDVLDDCLVYSGVKAW